MQRHFCDLCDSEVGSWRGNSEKAQWDRKAPGNYGKDCKITFKLLVGLNGHATGWGGPPDICDDCVREEVRKYFKFKKD